MTSHSRFDPTSIVPEGTDIDPTATLGPRVLITSNTASIRQNVRLDAACVIGDGVTIGQGAWVRPGAVVLQSIPANAIVEGNPAQIVGYVQQVADAGLPNLRHLNPRDFSTLERPTKVPLDVGGAALFLMRRIIDARGSLSVGEVPTEVPFMPKRYFVVYDVPSSELRGEHAHKECQQFLICLHGSCRVLLDDGDQRCEVTLDSPDMGVFMPEKIWGTQYQYSTDAVLLVFASHSYNADDYLRTYDSFLEHIKG
jgi:hypothetical protein